MTKPEKPKKTPLACYYENSDIQSINSELLRQYAEFLLGILGKMNELRAYGIWDRSFSRTYRKLIKKIEKIIDTGVRRKSCK